MSSKNIPLEGAITQNSYLYLSPVLLKRFEKCKINLFKLKSFQVLRNSILRDGLLFQVLRNGSFRMVKQSAQTMGVVRAKNARQKRKLKKEEPKVFENTKNTVLIKGGNVSNTLTQVMHDFHRLKVK